MGGADTAGGEGENGDDCVVTGWYGGIGYNPPVHTTDGTYRATEWMGKEVPHGQIARVAVAVAEHVGSGAKDGKMAQRGGYYQIIIGPHGGHMARDSYLIHKVNSTGEVRQY